MMTNEELLQKMQEECNLRNLSHWTLKEYLSKAYVMIEHFSPKPLATITDDELRIFLIYLRDERKLTPSSINVYNSAIRFIFGAIVGRPVNYQKIPRCKIVRPLPDIMSEDEIIALFHACDDGTTIGLRDKAILMTIYASGLRLSEVANLRGSDIYASSSRIKVNSGKGNKDRFTILSKDHLSILSTYYKTWKPQTDDGWLFTTKYGKKMSGHAIQDLMRVRLRLAGLSHKPYTPHTLRHNFATAMLNGGTDVCVIKKLLGHTHIQSTTFYLHLADFEEGLESPLDRLNKKKKDGESND